MRQKLTHSSDIMLQQLLVQQMRNLQPIDEHKHRGIFIAVGHLGDLILEVVDIRLETVTGSHFNSEGVVVLLLVLSAGGY